MSKAEASLAARLLEGSEIELLPTRSLLEAATPIAIANDCRFVTADERFVRKIGRGRHRSRVISLIDAAAER